MRFVFYTTFALSFISSALALPSTKGDAAAVGDVLTGLTSLVATLAGVVQGFTLNATVTGAVSVQTEVSLILEAVNAATVLVSQAPPATVVQGEVILVALGNLATQSQVVLVLFKTAFVGFLRVMGADIGLIKADLVTLEAEIKSLNGALSGNLPSDARDSCNAIFAGFIINLEALIVFYS